MADAKPMSASPTSRSVVKPRSRLARKKPRRKMRQVRRRRLHHPGDVQPGPINVHVSINQSWHQDTVTAVDDLVVTRGSRSEISVITPPSTTHLRSSAAFPIRRRRCEQIEIQFFPSFQVTSCTLDTCG